MFFMLFFFFNGNKYYLQRTLLHLYFLFKSVYSSANILFKISLHLDTIDIIKDIAVKACCK